MAVRCLGTRYGRISHREATLATADQDAGEEPGACLAEAPSRGVERLKQDRLFDLFPMKVRVHRCHATPHAHIIDRCLCALPIRSLHRSPVYNTRAHIMLRGSKAADWIGLRKSYPTTQPLWTGVTGNFCALTSEHACAYNPAGINLPWSAGNVAKQGIANSQGRPTPRPGPRSAPPHTHTSHARGLIRKFFYTCVNRSG